MLRATVVLILLAIIAVTAPIMAQEPELGGIKCGNCPCNQPCPPPPSPPIYQSPPPPPPSPPPPSPFLSSPPPPPKNPPSKYCPPPPPTNVPSGPFYPTTPSSPSIYFTGPPGDLYPINQNSGAGDGAATMGLMMIRLLVGIICCLILGGSDFLA